MLDGAAPATEGPADGLAATGTAAVPRRRLRVTRAGWAAIALTGWIFAAAVMSHASLMLLVFCILVSVVAVGAIETVGNLRKLEAVRRLPDHAVAGRPFRIEVELSNRRWIGAARAVTVSAEPPEAAGPDAHGLFVPVIPPGSRVVERQEVVVPERGLYRLPQLELASQFPFAFLEQRVQLGGVQQLLVFPRLGRLRRRFLEMDAASHPQQTGRRPRPSALEGDYHGLRDFRTGDSARWIHWATSARRGKLMVKEFESPRNRDVAVLLDAWLPAQPDAYHRSLLERAVSFAATLLAELCGRPGLHIVLGIAADRPLVRHGQASQRLLREFLTELALVQGSAAPAWESLFAGLPPTWIGWMRVTAVSPRPLHAVPSYESARRSVLRNGHRAAGRLSEIDVGSREAREVFDLE